MSAQVQKRPGTVVRLFANLKGQRLRLGVVAVSIVIYVALSIWRSEEHTSELQSR